MRQVIHVALVLRNILSWNNSIQHKRAFFAFRCTAFVLKWLPWSQHKYHSHILNVPSYSFIKFHVRIGSTNGNIRHWVLLNCAIIISDASRKQHFRFFCRFFSKKLSKPQSLKLNISRTAWPIVMILVSFCRILNPFR